MLLLQGRNLDLLVRATPVHDTFKIRSQKKPPELFKLRGLLQVIIRGLQAQTGLCLADRSANLKEGVKLLVFGRHLF